MSREAMQMALEALELYQSKMSVQMFDEAITALREALDADQWYEKILWGDTNDETIKAEYDKQLEISQAYQRGWNAALAQKRSIMCDERLIDEVATLWVENGGDAEGIAWCWKRIQETVEAKLKENT